MDNNFVIVAILLFVTIILICQNNDKPIKDKCLQEKITKRVIANINNYIKKNIVDYSNKLGLLGGTVTVDGLNNDELIKSIPNIIFNTIYNNLIILVNHNKLDKLEKELHNNKIHGVRYTYMLQKEYPSIQFRMIEVISGDISYQLVNELRDELYSLGKDKIVKGETVKVFDKSILERLILGSEVLNAEISYVVSSVLEVLNLT